MKELKISGYKLVVSSISPLAPKAIEIQYKKTNLEPEQPTYTVKAVGDVVETFKHTAESVETPEEKAALLAWKEKHDEWMSGLTYKLLRLFLSQGVELKLTPKQQKSLEVETGLLELDVPENKTERDLFYIETFVLTDQDKMQTLIEEVLAETGISSEALEVAAETFPD